MRSGDKTLRQGDSLSQIWISDVMPVHRDSELATMTEHFFGYGSRLLNTDEIVKHR